VTTIVNGATLSHCGGVRQKPQDAINHHDCDAQEVVLLRRRRRLPTPNAR
jgi:hypothetical protein